jgi:hypothetical protein
MEVRTVIGRVSAAFPVFWDSGVVRGGEARELLDWLVATAFREDAEHDRAAMLNYWIRLMVLPVRAIEGSRLVRLMIESIENFDERYSTAARRIAVEAD